MKKTQSKLRYKNKEKNFLSLFFWIITFQLVGFFIGKMTQNNISKWYNGLIKSPLNPPDFIFPIAWGFLYVILAIVGWYLYKNKNRKNRKLIFNLYIIQIFMNWMWTPLFFKWHMITFSFFWIVGMILLTLGTLLLCIKHFKLISILLSPYLLWLIFASYLNYFLWLNN